MLELLKNVKLFQNLSEEQLRRIASHCKRINRPSGTVLFHENDVGSEFYILLKGAVKIFTRNKQGEEKILAVLKEGENFGELSLIDGKPRSASAQTVEDSTLYLLSGDDFLKLLSEDFQMTREIMKELCQRLRDTNAHVYDLTFLDARTRTLKNLIMMANKTGTREGNYVRIRMSLNYDELSQMAGVSKNDLTHVLRELEQLGILRFYPNEFQLDLSKLRSS